MKSSAFKHSRVLLLTISGAVATGFFPAPLFVPSHTLAAEDQASLEVLARNQARFELLTSEEQRRLRQLDAAISHDPNSSELRQVMQQYHAWHQTLSPAEKTAIAELSAAEKLAKVREIHEQQLFASSASQLTPQDHEELRNWLRHLAEQNREILIAQFPKDQQQIWRSTSSPAPPDQGANRPTFDRDRFFRSRLVIEFLQLLEKPEHLSLISEADFQQLQAALSPEPAKTLASISAEPSKIKLVRSWYNTRLQPGFRRIEWRNSQLKEFFEQLPAEEQRRILQMADSRLRDGEIHRLYHEFNLQQFIQQLPEAEQQKLTEITNAQQRLEESNRLYFRHSLQEFIAQLPEHENQRLAAIADSEEREREEFRLYTLHIRRSSGLGGSFFRGPMPPSNFRGSERDRNDRRGGDRPGRRGPPPGEPPKPPDEFDSPGRPGEPPQPPEKLMPSAPPVPVEEAQ